MIQIQVEKLGLAHCNAVIKMTSLYLIIINRRKI